MSTPASSSATPTAPRRIWTTLDLLKWTREFFARKGIESPRLEAELLLAGAVGCERVKLYTDFEKPLDDEVLARFRAWVKRRVEQREPLAYILGCVQFIELHLEVSPAVLIPRPETEELALWARTILKECHERPEIRVLDIGTGSGCLALALAHGAPNVRPTAVDISPDALDVARRNAATLHLTGRVQFLESDVYAGLPAEHRGTYDLLVANPPYIDPGLKATLPPEVREHEPAQALFAESKGLAIVNRIVDEAHEWLKPDGWLGIEISPEQAGSVRDRLVAKAAFASVEIRKDARQLDRMILAHR
jgi:release factor glutamine methyltransferase